MSTEIEDDPCPLCGKELDNSGDCPACISKITDEEFLEEIMEMLTGMTSEAITSIPGVYEILAEEFNNEALSNIYQAKANRR